jgi:hypothetical protein
VKVLCICVTERHMLLLSLSAGKLAGYGRSRTTVLNSNARLSHLPHKTSGPMASIRMWTRCRASTCDVHLAWRRHSSVSATLDPQAEMLEQAAKQLCSRRCPQHVVPWQYSYLVHMRASRPLKKHQRTPSACAPSHQAVVRDLGLCIHH